MASETTPSIRVVQTLSASPEAVFDAWLNPTHVEKFLFVTPTGEMTRVDIDPQIGGRYEIVECREGIDFAHAGEYTELDRPQRLAFTFEVRNYSDTTDHVTLDFTPAESGCEVTLTHTFTPKWPEQAESIRTAWTGILTGLDQVLAEIRTTRLR